MFKEKITGKRIIVEGNMVFVDFHFSRDEKEPQTLRLSFDMNDLANDDNFKRITSKAKDFTDLAYGVVSAELHKKIKASIDISTGKISVH